MKYIWIFSGKLSNFPSSTFSSKKNALFWINENKLTGTLSKYPINVSVYDWAISNNYFTPKNDFQRNAKTIENFNSAYMEHYHFENGNVLD